MGKLIKIGTLLGLAVGMQVSVAWASIATTPITLSTSSQAIITAPGQNSGQLSNTASFLLIKNESTSDSIACALGYSSLPTAALNTAGSITIPAGVEQVLATPFLANAYLACKGAGADPITLVVY